MEAQTNPPTYRLGLAMAGAVSAGAYTAGAMDHVFQTLRIWAMRQEEDQDSLIPRHRIEIEALSGASAGGIMAALVAFARHVPIPPVMETQVRLDRSLNPTGNLFFDTWVNLVDTAAKTTFDQLLETPDLEEEGLVSLFNARVIDRIADKVKETVMAKWDPNGTDLSPFMARDMEMIITLCNLEGIPFGIDFHHQQGRSRKTPSYRMVNHKLIAWFGYQRQPGQAIQPIGTEHLDPILECAKGTSAFPIGFKPRTIYGWSRIQVRESLRRLQGISSRMADFVLQDKIEPFSFDVVDGGTLNNEPFSELFRLLQWRQSRKNLPEETVVDKPMIILVDPFPDLHLDAQDDEKSILSLSRMVGHLISTLLNQSRFKLEDLMDNNGMDGFERGMIFPSRYVIHQDASRGERMIPLPKGSHIACGPIGGFAGFLHRKFRVHDFLLGQLNARMFLRYFCTLPCNPKEPDTWPSIFRDWTPYMVMRYMSPTSMPSIYHLPVIPELDLIERVEQLMRDEGETMLSPSDYLTWREDSGKFLPDELFAEFERRKKYTQQVADGLRRGLVFPEIPESDILRYRKPLKKRVRAMLLTLMRRKVAAFTLPRLMVFFYPGLLLWWRKRARKDPARMRTPQPVRRATSGWWITALLALVIILAIVTPFLMLKTLGLTWAWSLFGTMLSLPLMIYVVVQSLAGAITHIAMRSLLTTLHDDHLIRWTKTGNG